MGISSKKPIYYLTYVCDVCNYNARRATKHIWHYLKRTYGLCSARLSTVAYRAHLTVLRKVADGTLKKSRGPAAPPTTGKRQTLALAFSAALAPQPVPTNPEAASSLFFNMGQNFRKG